jgi:hypothetical protein
MPLLRDVETWDSIYIIAHVPYVCDVIVALYLH